VPLGVIPFNAFIILGGGLVVSDFLIYSLTWAWSPGVYMPISMIPMFILINIWLTLPLTILNIAYIWKVVRYYRGDCTRYSAIWVGMLSLVLPTLIAICITIPLNPSGGFVFIGPIPLQFIVGLIFMYKIPGPEMTSPWKYDLSERSWWQRNRPDWWEKRFPDFDKEESTHKESGAESETS
jgi:hypothetical protein